MHLYNICESGNLNQLQQIIEKTKPSLITKHHWDYGLYLACLNGHLPVAELLIEKGAKSFHLGLEGACRRQHYSLVLLLSQQNVFWRYPHPYVQDEAIQLRLLSDGITRSQLDYFLNSSASVSRLFCKLDEANKVIKQVIMGVLPYRDLIPLCAQYACL